MSHGRSSEFRTCPDTGLKVDLAAERLIKVNAVAAVIFLLVGGLGPAGRADALARRASSAGGVVLSRPDRRTASTCCCSGSSSSRSRSSISPPPSSSTRRLATPWLAWLGFALMVIGGALANVAVLQGNSSVMFTSYVPMQAAPNFYLG